MRLNRVDCDTVNLYFQDESRFGLITKQKRVVTAKGIKPIDSTNTVVFISGFGVVSLQLLANPFV